jgi:hypothetical protein
VPDVAVALRAVVLAHVDQVHDNALPERLADKRYERRLVLPATRGR